MERTFIFRARTAQGFGGQEFYTEQEVIDYDRFLSLGVIKNSVKRDLREIDEIFRQLRDLFDGDHVTKAGVIGILKRWLPDFEHIEKGKGLDSKM